MKVILLLAGLFLVAGIIYVSSQTKNNQTTQPSNVQNTVTQTQKPEATKGSETANVKTFEVEGKPFAFTPNEIRVKKGDTVKIVFKNTEGFHDWTVDEFNAQTKQIPAGQTETIEFVADKTGTFEYYCSVGTHRQMGMVGKLIVEE